MEGEGLLKIKQEKDVGSARCWPKATPAPPTVLAVTDAAAVPAAAAIAAGDGVVAVVIGAWRWPCCCSRPPSRVSTLLSCAHSPSCSPARLCASCNSIISI